MAHIVLLALAAAVFPTLIACVAIMMENHGVTTLGATPAEAYHRLNTLAAELRRVMQAEMLARAAGAEVAYLAPDAVDFMYRNARELQYASRDRQTPPM